MKGRAAPTHPALLSKERLLGDGYPCEYEQQKRIFKIEGPYREAYIFLKNEKTGACSKITEKEDTTLNDFFKHQQAYSLSAEISPSEFVAISLSQTGAGEEDATAAIKTAPDKE